MTVSRPIAGIVGNAGQGGGAKPVSWIWLLTVLVLAELAAVLETTMIFAAMPAALRAFGRPEVIWLATGYLLVAGASAALAARLGDLFGRSQVLMAILAVATLGSVLAAEVSSLGWIIAGRSIQGLAGAVLPLAYGLVREYVPKARMSLGVGILTGAASLGAALGFVLGGFIVDTGFWQHVFLWSAGIAFAALVLCWISLPRSVPNRTSDRLDLFGGVLFAPGIALLLAAASFARDGRPIGLITSLSLAGIVILFIWVRHELRHPRPLIDVRLFRIPEVSLANLAGGLLNLGVYQLLIIFPLLMQQPTWTGIGFGVSATLTGLLKLPCNVAAMIAASLAGMVGRRFSAAAMLFVGFVVCAGSWTGMLFDINNLPYIVLMFCLSSVGTAVVLTGIANLLIASAPHDRTSEATGVATVVQMISLAIGAALATGILTEWTIAPSRVGGHAYPTPGAFQAAILFVIGISLVGIVAALALMGIQRRSQGRVRADARSGVLEGLTEDSQDEFLVLKVGET